MGASSSIPQPANKSIRWNNIRLEGNTYISYSEEDVNADHLHVELLNSGYNMIQGNFLTTKKHYDFTIQQYQELVKEIMALSNDIIICVSEKTVTSFSQAIELNIALESKKNIVYIFTDENFTPANTPDLISLVSYHLWLPAYDAKTMGVAIETMETYRMLS
jgi:hypothetical protein